MPARDQELLGEEGHPETAGGNSLLEFCQTRCQYAEVIHRVRHTKGLAETVECRSLQEIQALDKPHFVRDLASDSEEILLAQVHSLHWWRLWLLFLRHDLGEGQAAGAKNVIKEALNQLVCESTMAITAVLQRQENREARTYTLNSSPPELLKLRVQPWPMWTRALWVILLTLWRLHPRGK